MQAYKFGVFKLDVAGRSLLKEGQEIPLPSKLFDILLLLLQKKGNLLTKEELMEKVWAGQFVEENNITVNISALRKILGESRETRKYIKTIPKSGYRFVAPVTNEYEIGIHAVTNGHRTSENGHGKLAEAICSLAAMPIINETEEPNLDYLSDGITESIINSLSQLSTLRVLARNTVFLYKGKELDAQQIGRELGVEAVLIGRILQFENRLIIRTELIDAADGAHLWGEQYNRRLSDIFVVQEEIAREVSENLRLKLSGEDQKQLAKRYTDNIEAYHLYLQGRYFWNKFNKEWVQKSIIYFEQAIAIDPKYSLAYAGLADAYLRLASLYLSPRTILPKAKAAALTAVAIDTQLAEAHAALGLVKSWFDFDWSGAEYEYQRALALNPASYLAHEAYGRHFMYLGRFDDALHEFEYALRLDPLFLQLYIDVGATLYIMRRYDEAIEQFRKVLDLAPNYYPARYALSWGYLQTNNFQSAVAELEQIWKLGEDAYLALGLMGYVYAVFGNRTEAEGVLKELKKKLTHEYVSPYSMVLIYLGLGEQEKVFKWLEKLYEDNSYWLLWLKIVPELDCLRSDSRFENLLGRIGLAP